MRFEVLPKREWGERRYRYACPNCGAHTARERYRSKAIENAAKGGKSPERRLTRMPVVCGYYKQHSFKQHTIKCEGCLPDGMCTSTSFADKNMMIAHMQRYCRGTPDGCPLARTCAAKYGK